MAVFTWECDPANVRESIEFNTLITQFESGKEQRRSKNLGEGGSCSSERIKMLQMRFGTFTSLVRDRMRLLSGRIH